MADVVDAATRSRMMAGIGGRDTKPEMVIRRALHSLGFRYRLHRRDLPGRPDVVLPRHKAVVLVHGCFWHRHANCRFSTTPATRPDFWKEKFARNVARDREVEQQLAHAGWRVAVVWECALSRHNAEIAVAQLAAWLNDAAMQRIEISTPDQDCSPRA